MTTRPVSDPPVPAASAALLPPIRPAGLRELSPRYDGFILDLWGVLHDGERPLPGVVDSLERLIAAGKRIVILSNAPRRAAETIARLTEIGIRPGLYHHVVTSGEHTWQHLAARTDPFYAGLGRACLHLGPERDGGMLIGLDVVRVATVQAADFILNTGTLGWEEDIADYETLLRAAAVRRLPMVCANPDLVVRSAGRLAVCAGMLAERYEALGGTVRWHGKPRREIYDTCFALLGIAGRERILAAGDSLRTDIAGANGAGIDSVLIAGGIHAEEFGLGPDGTLDQARLAGAIVAAGSRPTWLLPGLFW